MVPEQSPLTPVFDEATRQRTAEIIARYPQSRSALLPLLHLVQSVEGYVTPGRHPLLRRGAGADQRRGLGGRDVLHDVQAHPLRRAPGQRLHEHAVRGAGRRRHLPTLSRRLGVGHEETAGEPGTPGSITLEHAECLAACDLAPVLQVNYEYYDNQTVESAQALVDGAAARRASAADPRRRAHGPQDRRAGAGRDLPGPRRCGGRATRRPPETLRGAQLAADRHWVGTRDAGQAARPAGPAGEEVKPMTTSRSPRTRSPRCSPGAGSARAPGTSTSTSSWRATPRCGTRSPATRTS